MAYTTPTSRTTGELITASIWNTDVVDDLIALRTGALSIASQATGDFLYAGSASQVARLAAAQGCVPFYSSGWLMATPTLVLNRQVVQATKTGNTETTIYTYAVAGGTLGTTRGIRLSTQGDCANFADSYTFRLKYGGTTFAVLRLSGISGGGNHSFELVGTLTAGNATNVQYGVGRFALGENVGNGGTATSAQVAVGGHSSLAEDSTASKNLVLTLQHGGSSGSQVTHVNSVQVELLT